MILNDTKRIEKIIEKLSIYDEILNEFEKKLDFNFFNYEVIDITKNIAFYNIEENSFNKLAMKKLKAPHEIIHPDFQNKDEMKKFFKNNLKKFKTYLKNDIFFLKFSDFIENFIKLYGYDNFETWFHQFNECLNDQLSIADNIIKFIKTKNKKFFFKSSEPFDIIKILIKSNFLKTKADSFYSNYITFGYYFLYSYDNIYYTKFFFENEKILYYGFIRRMKKFKIFYNNLPDAKFINNRLLLIDNLKNKFSSEAFNYDIKKIHLKFIENLIVFFEKNRSKLLSDIDNYLNNTK